MVQELSIQRLTEELRRMKRRMATKVEVAALAETIDILGNPDTMRQIEESAKDINHGRTKRVHSVADVIDEFTGTKCHVVTDKVSVS